MRTVKVRKGESRTHRRKRRKRAISKEVKRLTDALQKEQRTSRTLAKILVKSRLRRGKVPYSFYDE